MITHIRIVSFGAFGERPRFFWKVWLIQSPTMIL